MSEAISIGLESLLEDIRAQLAALTERVSRIENGAAAAPPPALSASAPAPEALKAPEPESISEEEVLAISAVLGAYLGVRVHIRQIRLISSRAWAAEGRVSIQVSHRLHS